MLSNPQLASFHVMMFTLYLLVAVAPSIWKNFSIWKKAYVITSKRSSQPAVRQKRGRDALKEEFIFEMFPQTQKQMLNTVHTILDSIQGKWSNACKHRWALLELDCIIHCSCMEIRHIGYACHQTSLFCVMSTYLVVKHFVNTSQYGGTSFMLEGTLYFFCK